MKPGSSISKFRAKLNQVRPSLVFLILALIVGGYVRLAYVLASPFPLNDGGLFYQMTRELVANHFRLPVFTDYNHLGMPYAYPPLAFYLAGGLSQLFGWPLIEIYRLLPAIVTVFTIPAFYLLAKELVEDDNHLSLAVLIFSLSPVTYNWAIMGGGVTRSLAFLFALLTLLVLYKSFSSKKSIYLLLAGILVSLTILAHPETGFHTAAAVPVFWFFLGRTKKGILNTLILVGMVMVFTAPWWLTVVSRHGLTPFISAFLTAGQDGNAFVDLLELSITDEIGISSIALLGMIGFFQYIAQKRYFLPAFLLVSYFVAPRSAKIFIAPVLAILASYTVITILNLLDHAKNKNEENSHRSTLTSSAIGMIFLALLFFQWFTNGIRILMSFNYIKLTDADVTAFDWIKANTSEDSRFVILTGYLWSSDPVSEWMPAYTGRTSVGTVQGTEWLGDGRFLEAVVGSRVLQNCRDQSVVCMEEWADTYNAEYDHVYIRKQELDVVEGKEFVPVKSALAELLKTDPDYQLVYETDEVSIFEKR